MKSAAYPCHRCISEMLYSADPVTVLSHPAKWISLFTHSKHSIQRVPIIGKVVILPLKAFWGKEGEARTDRSPIIKQMIPNLNRNIILC